MSYRGIKLFAQVLSTMQEARGELLRGASRASKPHSHADKQDIRLGQMLEEMKDVVKDRFANETLISKSTNAG